MRFLLAFIVMSFVAYLYAGKQTHHSPYAGQEKRAIKSLSADDVKQLLQGKGWGLAKAAELNGMPGPIHVLELKNKIKLSALQEQRIRLIFKQMKKRAITQGKLYVNYERKLNRMFATGKISPAQLDAQLELIGKTRAKLRYVHLYAHIETAKVMTKAQITLYNKLRGYGQGDACQNIPAGHNRAMWKKHHGCK